MGESIPRVFYAAFFTQLISKFAMPYNRVNARARRERISKLFSRRRGQLSTRHVQPNLRGNTSIEILATRPDMAKKCIFTSGVGIVGRTDLLRFREGCALVQTMAVNAKRVVLEFTDTTYRKSEKHYLNAACSAEADITHRDLWKWESRASDIFGIATADFELESRTMTVGTDIGGKRRSTHKDA